MNGLRSLKPFYMFPVCSIRDFPPGEALFIIWRRSERGGLATVAAGSHRAMAAAWEAVVNQYPTEELTLQNRARVLRKRGPVWGLMPEGAE